MDDYFVKCARSGLSMLVSQMSPVPDGPIEYIDPICTILKLCLLQYKNMGTKISIKNNVISIQDPGYIQGVQRWMNSDGRDQLHQLKLPIFYFRGIVLGFIPVDHLNIDQYILNYINDLAIKGLKKIRITYENERKVGSMVKNCIDDYIKILSTVYTYDDYAIDLSNTKKTLYALYNEYTKLWNYEEFIIIVNLLKIADTKENPNIHNGIADGIDNILRAKDLEIDDIRLT